MKLSSSLRMRQCGQQRQNSEPNPTSSENSVLCLALDSSGEGVFGLWQGRLNSSGLEGRYQLDIAAEPAAPNTSCHKLQALILVSTFVSQ